MRKAIRFCWDLVVVLTVGAYEDVRALRRELRSDVRTVTRGDVD